MVTRNIALVTILALAIFALAGTAQAADPVVNDIYPELRADGSVYTVGKWSDGRYTDAISEYPERRADGSVVYVYVWNNGSRSISVREYSERRGDGSVWLVRQWEDGAYSARLVRTGFPEVLPSTSAERAAARDAAVSFMNTFWPIGRQLNPCSARLNRLLPTLERREDQIRAIDVWVKCFEPQMPAVSALVAPQIPLLGDFVVDYKQAILLEFDAGKRLNWGLVTEQEAIAQQAGIDLQRSAEQEFRAFLTLDLAVLLYGLRYDEALGPYGTWN